MKIKGHKKTKFERSRERAFRGKQENKRSQFSSIDIDPEILRNIMSQTVSRAIEEAIIDTLAKAMDMDQEIRQAMISYLCSNQEVDYECDIEEGYNIDEAWEFLANRNKNQAHS